MSNIPENMSIEDILQMDRDNLETVKRVLNEGKTYEALDIVEGMLENIDEMLQD